LPAVYPSELVIHDPILGNYYGFDLPSFSALKYDLLVTYATAINEVGSYR